MNSDFTMSGGIPQDPSIGLEISRFRNAQDNVPQMEIMRWPELVELLSRHDHRAEKDGPAWSPVQYPPGVTRSKQNVETLCCLVLDFDDGPSPEFLTTQWSRWTYTLHSTYSHSPAHSKWRIVFPLATPVAAGEWPAVYRKLALALGKGQIDPSCKDASRIYYFPSAPSGTEPFTFHHDGEWLDPAAFPEIELPRISPPVSLSCPIPIGAANGSRYAEAALEAELTQLSAAPVGFRNTQLNRSAFALGTLVGGGLLNHDEVEAALTRFAQWIGLDESEIAPTIASGLTAGELQPRTLPEEDKEFIMPTPAQPALLPSAATTIEAPDRSEENVRQMAKKAAEKRAQNEELSQCRLADCIPQHGFIRDFVDLHRPVTEAPELFHVAAALSCIATALNRLTWLDNGAHRLYPNLYIALVAGSTWMRKSTVLKEAEDFLGRLGENHNDPYRFSLDMPQTINAIGLWTENPRGLITHDEIGGWLKSSEQLSFMAGVKTTLKEIHDCPPVFVKSFRGEGKSIRLEKPYINLLSATTWDWFAEAVIGSDIGSGFLPRFMFFVARPEESGDPLPLPPPMDSALKDKADDSLFKISQRDGSMNLGPEAKEQYTSWYLENSEKARKGQEHIVAFRGRLGDYVLKLAMLYQAADDQGDTIQERNMAYAISLSEFLLARTEKLVRENLMLGQDRALCDRIMRMLRKADEKGLTT